RQMAPPRMSEGLRTGARMLGAMLERLREEGGGELPPGGGMAALGGAEAVVRRELVAGRAGELPRLLPGVVYAAAGPSLGQEEALRMTRQAHELLAGTRWSVA